MLPLRMFLPINPTRRPRVADDKYDQVLAKAKIRGINSLTPNELELFKKLAKEVSPRGRDANRLIDGR